MPDPRFDDLDDALATATDALSAAGALSAALREAYSVPAPDPVVVTPPPVVVPPPVEEPPASAFGLLSWAPPAGYEGYKVLNVTKGGPKTLDKTTDYLVVIADGSVNVGRGLDLNGGRNVVLIGGTLIAPGSTRALYIRDAQGIVHIEGLHIEGADEGINVHSPNADVRIQNVMVGSAADPLAGEQSAHHADVLQCFGGPQNLRVDRLEGWTTYQGFMLQPHQFGSSENEVFDFRNVTLHRRTGSGYLVYNAQSGYSVKTENVLLDYTDGGGVYSTSKAGQDYSGVKRGSASPIIGKPGVNYVSPGYARA